MKQRATLGVTMADSIEPRSSYSKSGPELRRTARVTGLWYFAMALVGMLGFLVIRSQIYIPGDPTSTLGNLVDKAALARSGLVLELALVVAQAMTAVWFYKLFRPLNPNAALAVAVFGMANAVAIMASAGFMATALALANGPSGLVGDLTGTIHLLQELSSNTWGVGAVFFGLWLIPMGHAAGGSGLMSKWLGRTLIVGGCGYLLSAFLSYGLARAPGAVVDGLTIPATIGEFWMIGYLLFARFNESARS